MDIQVRSRTKMYEEMWNKIKEPTLVLSISSYGDHFPNFKRINHNIIQVSCMFDDVETERYGMTEEDAKKFADAVRFHKSNVDRIFVHCDAGISRSSGVAAAVGKYLNDDDWFVFGNGMYCPNMRCYRLMMEQFFGEYDENEANRLLKANEDLYKNRIELFDGGFFDDIIYGSESL